MTISKIILSGGIIFTLCGCTRDDNAVSFSNNKVQSSVDTLTKDIDSFHNVAGTYVGIVKGGAGNQYNSVQMNLLPNSSFYVNKQNIKGDKSTSRIQGTYTVSGDTLTLYHVMYQRKFLLIHDEIHYLDNYDPKNFGSIKKCMKNILYKIN